MTEAEDRWIVLTSIFRRKGANGRFMRLFEDLESGQREVLAKGVFFLDDELPVIGMVEREDRWLVLTTRRLVWRNGAAWRTVAMREIEEARVDVAKMVASGAPKASWRELKIRTIGGGNHVLEMEEGQPFWGMLSLLLNQVRRNFGRGATEAGDEKMR